MQQIPDYLGAYCKLTRIATKTDRSQMTPDVHRAFMTYLERAQTIIRLEAEQAHAAHLSLDQPAQAQPAQEITQ